MERPLGAGATVILAHIEFVYPMSECCPFISIKFTRIYQLMGYFSNISHRWTYPWTHLDDTVALILFLIKKMKTCSFAHRCALILGRGLGFGPSPLLCIFVSVYVLCQWSSIGWAPNCYSFTMSFWLGQHVYTGTCLHANDTQTAGSLTAVSTIFNFHFCFWSSLHIDIVRP